MSRSSSAKASKTDWPRIKAMKDKDITLTAGHPAAEVKHIVRGIARRGLRPILPKASISLRVDVEVLEWFKSSGGGYQARMNGAPGIGLTNLLQRNTARVAVLKHSDSACLGPRP
jgi:uncharacterized protein (DUF4415 family)